MSEFDELNAPSYKLTPKGIIANVLLRSGIEDSLEVAEAIYMTLLQSGETWQQTNEILDGEVAILLNEKGGRFINVAEQ